MMGSLPLPCFTHQMCFQPSSIGPPSHQTLVFQRRNPSRCGGELIGGVNAQEKHVIFQEYIPSSLCIHVLCDRFPFNFHFISSDRSNSAFQFAVSLYVSSIMERKTHSADFFFVALSCNLISSVDYSASLQIAVRENNQIMLSF